MAWPARVAGASHGASTAPPAAPRQETLKLLPLDLALARSDEALQALEARAECHRLGLGVKGGHRWFEW